MGIIILHQRPVKLFSEKFLSREIITSDTNCIYWYVYTEQGQFDTKNF